jgi:antitoxin component YwqK of YwqJK toxin-antitoxin module
MNAFYRFNRTGIVYEGEWLNGKPHGYGKNYYPNGGYY